MANAKTNLAAAAAAYEAAILALRDAYVELKACDMAHEQACGPGHTMRGNNFAHIQFPHHHLHPLPDLDFANLDQRIHARLHELTK